MTEARWWISERRNEDAERPWALMRMLPPAPEKVLEPFADREAAQAELNRIAEGCRRSE